MQTSAVRIYSLKYDNVRTYIIALLFVAGNIVLPQLFHLLPSGGKTWLPIYFFTLVGAYKYGWRAGLLTAFISPLANSALFGMPSTAVLPAILMKSALLALFAGIASERFRRATMPLMLAVVVGYQVVGTLGEWLMSGSLALALQDFRIGIPGLLLQILGGWAVINFVIRK